MEIEVHLFANLSFNRFLKAPVHLDNPATVTTLLEVLGIHLSEIGAVFINGRDGTFEQALVDGDRVTLLPCIGGG